MWCKKREACDWSIHRAGVSILPKLMSQRRRRKGEKILAKKSPDYFASESNARSSLLVLLSAPVDNTPFKKKKNQKNIRHIIVWKF
jgi:hypothetical protein